MLIAFFDIEGTIHFEFIPQGQTANQAYYVEILKRLREAVRIKGPEHWPNDWILRHDNGPAHKALSVKQFLAQKSITEMKHPPYSPDLSPNNLWLFPKIKSALKGRGFQDTEDIQKI
jgi:histone-lysine N-methyltransferase SETMAR